ncbi:MAG: hypothetical protein HC828_08045 [Blastochloris sp.]|nr:hypothetical protein [Blastochloris sp.]
MTTNIHSRIAREVALEADHFYDEAKELGKSAFDALTRQKRAQITGLESVANTTQKVSDILNYIKTRAARQKQWRNEDFSANLLTFLETSLKQSRDKIVDNLKDQQLSLTPHQEQEVYILLIRAFIAQLAAQYEFASIQGEPER